MSAIGTLMATAAVSVGVVAVIKSVRRAASRRAKRASERPVKDETIIELEADQTSGVWRDPKSAVSAD